MMIYHGVTETPSKFLEEELTEGVIGRAIEVQRGLRPRTSGIGGEQCTQFHLGGISFERPVALVLELRVANWIADTAAIGSLRAFDHRDQVPGTVLASSRGAMLTHMKMTGKRVGLILNLNVPVLTRGGVIRKVL